MRNDYLLVYGYKSILDPTRMFSEREDARKHDISLACSQCAGRTPEEMSIAINDGNQALMMALSYLVSAHSDIETEKSVEKWRRDNAAAAKIEQPQIDPEAAPAQAAE